VCLCFARRIFFLFGLYFFSKTKLQDGTVKWQKNGCWTADFALFQLLSKAATVTWVKHQAWPNRTPRKRAASSKARKLAIPPHQASAPVHNEPSPCNVPSRSVEPQTTKSGTESPNPGVIAFVNNYSSFFFLDGHPFLPRLGFVLSSTSPLPWRAVCPLLHGNSYGTVYIRCAGGAAPPPAIVVSAHPPRPNSRNFRRVRCVISPPL
jgi:hypothetical protein